MKQAIVFTLFVSILFSFNPTLAIAKPPVSSNSTGEQWQPVIKGTLAAVDVEQRLYEKEGTGCFFIRVRLINLSKKPIGIDLSNSAEVIYLNQWGVHEDNHGGYLTGCIVCISL